MAAKHNNLAKTPRNTKREIEEQISVKEKQVPSQSVRVLIVIANS